MAILHDLIQQVDDPKLRERIMLEVDRAFKHKKFGLVFEEHLPECTPLFDIPLRGGVHVALKAGPINDIWTILKVNGDEAVCANRKSGKRKSFKLDDLVAVAEFGEPIYPYLKPVDTVCNAPDSNLWHTLIEADNYHALQLLEYLYAGKVDCIYIDPPYNTGARDWKYNNDYVDNNDAYRHSKWLSMMQKRLKIAKRLLNPSDSVLIVTIDEKEYLHLGCLLEELFPEARMQMVSSVINPAGAVRAGEFSRTNEYLFFLMLGSSAPCDFKKEGSENEDVHWNTLRRTDLSSVRHTRPRQFYPIFVDDNTRRIVSVGDPLKPDDNRMDVSPVQGCTAVFPVRPDGTEMNWGITGEELMSRARRGYVKVGRHSPSDPQKYSISYLKAGPINDIETGKAEVIGYDDVGAVVCRYKVSKGLRPTTQWAFPSHDAYRQGTNVIAEILGKGRFTFPKSIYAVRDCIDLYVRNKPNALIVDFFAGSGTTLHAVNLLNAEDGGNRRCIMVTNNEVSDAEAKQLAKDGFKPGDDEWERLGIARYVTWPRTVCSIEGHDVNGQPIKGVYLNNNRPMVDGFQANAAFFKLGFLDKTSVALGRQFGELLPTLWMKAGAVGPCPSLDTDDLPAMLVLPENAFAVLLDESYYQEFVEQLTQNPEVRTVFIVTDSQGAYRDMIRGLDTDATFQLYRDYLDNFRINTGR